MRILLDTHILLWWLNADKRLPVKAEQIIVDPNKDIYISAVNSWEVAIKKSLGRLEIDLNQFEKAIQKSGLDVLDITVEHTLFVAKLPYYHKDPFDRLLISQSRVEPMHLLTHDNALLQYGESIVLV